MSSPSRTNEDIKRDEKVYWFLLKLSGIIRNPDKLQKPEIRDIAEKWGFQKDRTGQKFVERVLSNLYDEDKNKPALPSLSLNRLVEILKGIDNYWKQQKTTNSIPIILQKRDKIRAIRKYCELTRKEKKDLGLPVDLPTFIEENFIDSSDNYIKTSNQVILTDYPDKKYVDINIEKEQKKGSVVSTIDREYLNNLVKEVIEDKFSEEWINNNQLIVEEIQKKVKEEITVIAVQSGLEIARYHLSKTLPKECLEPFSKAYKKQWESQLSDNWIKQLTSIIIDNKRISDKIPITLRFIEIKKIGPLPFEFKNPKNDLINEQLLEEDPDEIATREAFNIFKRNNAYQVRIHYRLKFLNEDNKEENQKDNIDFVEEISGMSSILSLVHKALNRGLLWDIPCLKEYFPVVQEVYIEDKLFGGVGLATVWSKLRGRLIRLDDLKELLEGNRKKEGHNKDSCDFDFDFDCYVEGSDVIQADYVGFDLTECIAKSGFFLRLKLIENTGIDPEIYLEQLKRRIEKQKYLLEGKKYLRSYPFSLLAMKNYLEEKILKDDESNPPEQGTKIADETKLSIIRGFLDEGLVNTAGKLLQEFETHFDKGYFSHFLKVGYYLCQAEYTFLSHEDELGKTQQQKIDTCKEYLDKAEEELRQRLRKFFRIGEMAQGNLSPSYYYWTKIYMMRAKLSLFFPKYLAGETVLQLFPSLVSFGKARVYYAPREGDSYLCAKVSLYQSWCYLIQGYIDGQPKGFSKQECIDWAKKLIDHALINYQDTSQECYRDYTDNLFYNEQNQKKFESLKLKIDSLPFLHLVLSDKIENENNEQGKDNSDKIKNENNEQVKNNSETGVRVYKINANLIKRNLISTLEEDKKIDLFGQHSSLYFFALGMVTLCDNYTEKTVLKNLEDAYDYFVCSWAIAEGGSKLDKDKNTNVTTLERIFDELKIGETPIRDNFEVSKLRGLFFHRISEWVDLAKIFMAVSRSIIGDKFEVVNAILDEDEDVFSKVPEDFKKVEITNGQEKYNRHLESTFKRIKSYLRDYVTNFDAQHKNKSLVERRDEIVKAIFLRLRGD